MTTTWWSVARVNSLSQESFWLTLTCYHQEMAQMVCGSCRRLLAYPRGARHVKCSCCQTVNFVLEAHQVGQVKCASCAVLLMYPYGAPSVRCSSCCFVTEIGVCGLSLFLCMCDLANQI
ncbi:hypothetical protein CISIN_1g033096mg [Citrus sinensis]|uniref:Zinc finger LSD1-type domain-containing protein n=1 Tax=Citrus sinensis TaxID=2711 RepID=A0A067G8G9_CITSI|nr:hypothetical protein CISIN_1g033096mg [Citrus sinensis]